MGTHFAIAAMPRTGTNRLVAQLQAQQDVWCHNEVLQTNHVYVTSPSSNWKKEFPAIEVELLALRRADPGAFFDRILSMNYGRDHCGFKTLFGKNQDWALTQSVLENRSIAKIVLHRTNVLAAYSSYSAALQDGAWNSRRMHQVGRSRVLFSEKSFLQYRATYEERYRNIFETLQDQAHFVLHYDELNDQRHLARLLNYLGARAEVVSVTTPEVRGSRYILSRFSNPEDAENFLREHGLTHWAHEVDEEI